MGKFVHKWWWFLLVLLSGVFCGYVVSSLLVDDTQIYEEDNASYIDDSFDEEEIVNKSDNEIYLTVGDTLDVIDYLDLVDQGNISFEVDNLSVASIDERGELLALSEGSTNLLINVGSERLSFEVIVGSVESDLATLSSSTGLSRTYMTLIANSVSGRYRYFQLRYRGKIYSSKTWKSSDPSLVTVNRNGYVKVLKSPSVATNVVISVTIKDTVYNCTIRVVPKAKILFIGNSMTWNNGSLKSVMVNNSQLKILKAYFSKTNRRISFTYSHSSRAGFPVMGGRTLEQAYLDPTLKSNYVAGREYDFIVLQEQTMKLFYSYQAKNGTKDQKKDAKKQLSKLKKSVYNNRVDTDDVYTSYKNWLDYIYSNNNSMNAMTVVYIPPINTTKSLNATCESNGYSCNYEKEDIHKIQKKAYDELVSKLETYINANSNMKGKVLFAPVSVTWDKIRAENPYSIVGDLYTDTRHPDAYGQYIIASSLFYTISGSPSALTKTSDWTADYWGTYYKGGFKFEKEKVNYIRKMTIKDAKYYNFS